MKRNELARLIDHTLLKPDSTRRDARRVCEEAKEHGFAAACILPAWVADAAEILEGSSVAVCTVVGFPHGAHATATKLFEAEHALADGATELDMVLNIGRLRSGEDAFVRDEIRAIVAGAGRAVVKVILENAYLTDDEKVRGCRLAEAAGAHFVKTSTGFAPGGATHDDLRLMRATVSSAVQIKAAGGVRSLDALLEVMALGVTRVGATRTGAILDEYRSQVA